MYSTIIIEKVLYKTTFLDNYMAKKITPEQIGLANDAIANGRSIPEAAEIAKMSVSSVKKYCKDAIASMLASINNELACPTPIEKGQQEALTFAQFLTYIEHEFSECERDVLALKELFYELRAEYEGDYDYVIAIRNAYEKALNNLSRPTKVVVTNKDVIKSYRDKFKCRMTVSRNANEWSEQQLYGFITFHVVMFHLKKSFVDVLATLDQYHTIEQRKHYLESL